MNNVVSFALRQRTIILLMFITMMIGGLLAFRQLNIEAYPDPTPPSVEVVTQVAGLSVAYAPRETINLALGAFGDNESISRSSGAPATIVFRADRT